MLSFGSDFCLKLALEPRRGGEDWKYTLLDISQLNNPEMLILQN